MNERELQLLYQYLMLTRDFIRASFPEVKQKSLQMSFEIDDDCVSGEAAVKILTDDGTDVMISRRNFFDDDYFVGRNS